MCAVVCAAVFATSCAVMYSPQEWMQCCGASYAPKHTALHVHKRTQRPGALAGSSQALSSHYPMNTTSSEYTEHSTYTTYSTYTGCTTDSKSTMLHYKKTNTKHTTTQHTLLLPALTSTMWSKGHRKGCFVTVPSRIPLWGYHMRSKRHHMAGSTCPGQDSTRTEGMWHTGFRV